MDRNLETPQVTIPVLSVQNWDERFNQQAGWTASMRNYLYERLNLRLATRILDVGCGTGAITKDIVTKSSAKVYGLDLNLEFLRFARTAAKPVDFTCGDVQSLPYPDNTFDLLVCHFFLLWLPHLTPALSEMRRVTKRNGHIIAFAEPDYSARIDHPDALRELGRWQSSALKNQGADPEIGRRLSSELINSGLVEVESGLMGGEWRQPDSLDNFISEWTMIEADLRDIVSTTTLQELRQIDLTAQQKGERILFVPTFYAHGRKPAN
jgi:SAM-dependent methyltransferase